MSVPSGRALVGRAEYLDAELRLEAADSAPFVRIVSQKKELPGWLQKALSLPDVFGSGHLVLGTDSIRFEPMSLAAGKYYEVGLRWRRTGKVDEGALFAAYQALSVGFRFEGDDREVIPFDARKWFAAQGAPAAAEAEADRTPDHPLAEEADRRRHRTCAGPGGDEAGGKGTKRLRGRDPEVPAP